MSGRTDSGSQAQLAQLLLARLLVAGGGTGAGAAAVTPAPGGSPPLSMRQLLELMLQSRQSSATTAAAPAGSTAAPQPPASAPQAPAAVQHPLLAPVATAETAADLFSAMDCYLSELRSSRSSSSSSSSACVAVPLVSPFEQLQLPALQPTTQLVMPAAPAPLTIMSSTESTSTVDGLLLPEPAHALRPPAALAATAAAASAAAAGAGQPQHLLDAYRQLQRQQGPGPARKTLLQQLSASLEGSAGNSSASGGIARPRLAAPLLPLVGPGAPAPRAASSLLQPPVWRQQPGAPLVSPVIKRSLSEPPLPGNKRLRLPSQDGGGASLGSERLAG